MLIHNFQIHNTNYNVMLNQHLSELNETEVISNSILGRIK